ncbi:MAG: diaminopimelate epimerase [Acidimicrobiales bacterium]
MAELELAKYEALGNDFLILVDWERAGRFDAELAVALCDRHRGIGADGWLRLSAPDRRGALRIDLYNADGSRALTSGNGLRCAVLCAHDLGIVSSDRLVVETQAGDVAASLDGRAGGKPVIRVAMGAVRVVPVAPPPVEGWRAYSVDVGNPHLVLLGAALGEADVASLGPELSCRVPGGQNVEFVAPGGGADELDLVAWERGAGQTLACGSGSAAAAAAAHAAGLVGLDVIVHNPGGDLVVELTTAGDGVEATLVGSARRVGRIVVDRESLAGGRVRAT